MEGFTELANQYRPMIYHIIHSLNIYKNEDEFFQIALIALWEAQQRFNPEKGKFSTFAYSYMKGRMMTEMTRQSKAEEVNVYPDEVFWEMKKDDHEEKPLELDALLSYCDGLTDKQKQWVIYTFYFGLSVREIAEKEKVSQSAIKKWRTGAIEKMRGNIHTDMY
ncbi:sigma-70 family RNA polymerase sigma factor [Bacillus norwichensis]|uniref:Sigma-70 family RNA polymerase sigma factor n=1 Tax=Bacillus norwichensis TaxID=2762217 RepID=A0ABR8VLN2_9BACI|nr:sigma-70 family RNA polymerase sigma factor [Bacillus norwichensis]MBD8005346.1 sigma-70 family RNA polymerase sigma factor [Bacillus norwichensis]